MRLKNKVAVITGGASGIGRAIALRFAREGAHVITADIDDEKNASTLAEIRAVNPDSEAVHADVSVKEDVQRLMDGVVAKYGTIDVLVCAAGLKEAKSILDCTLEDWDRMLAVNLKGVLFCTQAAGKIMAQRGYGKIILIGSLSAIRARAGQVSYSASKGSLTGFVQNAAKQLAEYHVNINMITPGILDVEHPEPLREREEKIAHIPYGRPGKCEDLTGPALFLATEDSDYVCGISLQVDGAFPVRITGIDN